MIITQESIAAKRDELYQYVDQLLTIVCEAVQEQTPIHKVESKAWRKLLQAGLTTLQFLVDCLGNGDVGETHRLPDGRVLKRSEEVRPRPYVSIFGPLNIERFSVSCAGQPSGGEVCTRPSIANSAGQGRCGHPRSETDEHNIGVQREKTQPDRQNLWPATRNKGNGLPS